MAVLDGQQPAPSPRRGPRPTGDALGAAAEATVAAPPPPRLTARGVGIAVLCWLGYGVLSAVPLGMGEQMTVGILVVSQLSNVVLHLLLSLPVWWAIVRGLDGRGWGWTLLAHAVVAPLYAWAHYALTVRLYLLAGGDPGDPIGLLTQEVYIIFSNGLVYVAAFAILHAVRAMQRLRWRERQAAALETLAHERALTALRAQVHPHFLFNTLNAISARAPHDGAATRAMVLQLAGLLRYALDSRRHDLVPLRDEVAFVRDYLDLEAHRLGDRLTTRFDIDDDALDTPVPPVVVQPLVENAIKHGLAPLEAGGALTLTVRRAGERVEVIVADDGRGLAEASASAGIGLANTDERLRRTFGPHAALHVEPGDVRGFTVRFSVPYAEPLEAVEA